MWGEQDGGAGSIGTVLDIDLNDWAEVRWPNGKKEKYRYGADGKYELELVETPPSK